MERVQYFVHFLSYILDFWNEDADRPRPIIIAYICGFTLKLTITEAKYVKKITKKTVLKDKIHLF